ncbi:BREX-4 system phosphatase PglZ (plasmid) [Methanosphaera sp. ISO3-F5]|uniref:BREX-4 system phosphatase PglZ n=1 Tax=Methanosphaera sp. ISO3-F5 TaxID=1452353 RepID=UPI002B25EB51|nr:BREX-4 system phosphatase PglZ [Methanosphaera sp. ISO3-F5]WQH65335.1 BREX-4 system phosphatase PglZ [Methanosphaera sp. ISO3-F5]
MDSENIFEYSNLNDLKESVKLDLEEFNISSSRFPVRFIFLNSYEELKNVVEILSENATKIELSSFLFSENSWFTNSELIKKIKEINETSVIVPLSEYIRFLDDVSFNEIFSLLAGIENTNIKLYIPLVGLWERFNDVFWNNFYRKNNWAPIWKLKSNAKQICIYQIDGFDFKDNFETNTLLLISNTKQWFELWKKDNVMKIISLPKPLSVYFENSLPDKTFMREVITTPKEYLSKIFDINLNINYNPNEKEYWEYLLTDISKKNQKNMSLKDIFIEKFNINNIANLELKDYLNYYLVSKNIDCFDKEYRYKKWIVKNFFINSDSFKDSYLAHCLRKTNNLDNISLTVKIFLEIFNLEYSDKYLEERRYLLKILNQKEFTFPEQEFEENFNKITNMNYNYQLNYLTNTTFIEKEKIINIMQSNREEFNFITSKLKVIFPELYNYLNWNYYLDNISEWVLNYFKEYNKCKILNSKSDKLKTLLDELNSSPNNFYKWYYDLYNNQEIELNDDTYVLWIDALGVEWLPLFTYFLNNYLPKSNKQIKSTSIRSVNLPSATEFNKIDCDKKISYLDNYIHNNHYGYPKSLIEEIEIIREIAKEIANINSSKVLIYSDHGFSFLCNKKLGNSKKYNFEGSSHEGRYLKITNQEIYDTEDYMVTGTESDIDEKYKYLLTLKHVSLNNTPSHEVHGGGTPEEVLVPCILIEADDFSNIIYDVICEISEINVSLENRIPIKIYPEPKNMPSAIYNDEKLNVLKEDNFYVIEVNQSLSKGKQTIIIKINKQVEEIEINIKKGGMEEEEYDFGWEN